MVANWRKDKDTASPSTAWVSIILSSFIFDALRHKKMSISILFVSFSRVFQPTFFATALISTLLMVAVKIGQYRQIVVVCVRNLFVC